MTINLEVKLKGSNKTKDAIAELSQYGKVRDFGRFGAYHAMSVTGKQSDLLAMTSKSHKTCQVWVD